MMVNRKEFSTALNQYFISSAVLYIGTGLTTIFFRNGGFIAGIIGFLAFAASVYNLVLLYKFGKITSDVNVQRAFKLSVGVIIIGALAFTIGMFIYGMAVSKTGDVLAATGFLGIAGIIVATILAVMSIMAHILTVNFIRDAVPTDKVREMSKMAIYTFVGAIVLNAILSFVPVLGGLVTIAAGLYYVYYLYTANSEIQTLNDVVTTAESVLDGDGVVVDEEVTEE